MNKFLIGATTSILLISLSTGVVLAKTGTDRVLGGLDLNAYCQAKGLGYNASPDKGAPYKDWTCSTNGTGKDISLKAACKFQYGKSDDVWEVVPGDVYTYVCFR